MHLQKKVVDRNPRQNLVHSPSCRQARFLSNR